MDRLGRRVTAATAAFGVALTVLVGPGSGAARAAGQPSDGPPDPAALNVVLSGGYTCNHTVTNYFTGEDTPPATYTEIYDTLSMSTTGGLDPHPGAQGRSPASIGPGFGGQRPIVGGSVQGAAPISGFGTGHSFEGGTIEDCVRFAQAMAQLSSSLGCTTSDVRRRQPPNNVAGVSASAGFSFVCEGPSPAIVHLMGDLNRAVLGLRIQPAP